LVWTKGNGLSWLAIAALGAGLIAGLWDGIYTIVDRWIDSPAYSHGFLVVALALYAASTRIHGADLRPPRGSFLGLLLLAGVVLAYLLFDMLEFTTGLIATIPLALWASAYLSLGWRAARRLVMPALYLYLAVPVWDVVRGALARLATVVVSEALHLLDLQIHITANLIYLPSGLIEVTDDCSGISYLLVAMALSGFVLMRQAVPLASSALVIAVTLLIGFAANWLRIGLLVGVGIYSEMDHPLLSDHEFFGWIVFLVIALPPLVWLFGRLGSGDDESALAGLSDSRSSPSGSRGLLCAAAGAVLLLTPVLVERLRSTEAPLDVVPLTASITPPWVGASPDPGWRPAYQKPQQRLRAAYTHPGGPDVELYVARYLTQRPGSKLIASANHVEGRLLVISSGIFNLEWGNSRLQIQESHASGAGREYLIWHWFDVGGFMTAGERYAKLLQVPALLLGRTDGTLFAVAAGCDSTCDEARQALREFVTAQQATFDALARADAATGN